MAMLRTEFRLCQAARCWPCGGAIHYLLRDGNDALELDHYFPDSIHPQYEEDPATVRPSHRSCNRSRGDAHHQPASAPARAPGRRNSTAPGQCVQGQAAR